MLTVAQALARILDHVQPMPVVDSGLDSVLGSALTEDIASDVDSPPHDQATVDGYAIVAADLAAGVAELDVLEEITAGETSRFAVTRGQTSRVMTGAAIPAGADAMVMVERSEDLASGPTPRVRLKQAHVRPGQNILRRAASLARGDIVLRQGTVVRPIEIGLLAEVGRTQVRVRRRPSLAVLATGNELVDASTVPTAGQIRNSNSPLLLAAARRAGAVEWDLGIARDEPAELAARIEQGLACDVLVISGGVSAGVLDLVPAALRDLGVEQVFHKVQLKPGKPLWFGVRRRANDAGGAAGQTLVFGLPGNPVSSLVCFELFLRPALAKMAGAAPAGLLRLSARIGIDFQHRTDRPTYFPGRWLPDSAGAQAPARIHSGGQARKEDTQGPWVEPLAWRGSADLRTLADATVLIHFPAGDRAYAAGDWVDVLLLS